MLADPPAGPSEQRRAPRSSRGNGLFRAFWRWHFYASFLVIPVVFLLSVTGLIYLLRFETEPLLHSDLMKVSAPAGVTDPLQQPYAAQLSAVERAYPDATVISMAEPREEGRSTVFSIETADGAGRDVFVDPWDAQVLGDLDPDTTLSGIAVRLHADIMAGTFGDRVLEIGACWAIVMAITGYYLFFKGRAARARRRASKAAGAALRSRHGMTGAVLGVGLLLLVVSGLPWTGFWGAKVQEGLSNQGTSLWAEDHGALSNPTSTLDESLPHSHAVPWGLQKSDVPRSTAPAEGDEVSVANLDTAVEVGQRSGLSSPMTVALPADESGVFSVVGYAFDDPGKERTVHVDQYGGQVVSTYGYADYPAPAKVVAEGIALHEGRSLGLVNFWASLLFCLGVIFMCVTGPLMWWRRRPRGKGSVGAPRGRMPLAKAPLLAVLVGVLAVTLPMFGITLVAALLLDQLVLRRVPRLRQWFDVPATTAKPAAG
nr:PepSY domain-containing protein [Motilibacter deserti]